MYTFYSTFILYGSYFKRLYFIKEKSFDINVIQCQQLINFSINEKKTMNKLRIFYLAVRVKGNRPNARRVVSGGSGSSDTQSFSESVKSDSGGSGGSQTKSDSISNGLFD